MKIHLFLKNSEQSFFKNKETVITELLHFLHNYWFVKPISKH